MITMSFIIFSEALKSLFMMLGLPTVSAAHGMKVVSNYIVITDNDDDDVIFDKWQFRVTLWSGETWLRSKRNISSRFFVKYLIQVFKNAHLISLSKVKKYLIGVFKEKYFINIFQKKYLM